MITREYIPVSKTKNIEDLVNVLNQEFTKVHDRIDKVSTNLDKLNNKVSKLEGRIDKLENNIDKKFNKLFEHLGIEDNE